MVDDYFETGATYLYSSLILRQAGAASIKGMVGQWYTDVTSDYDRSCTIESLRAPHRGMMRAIGRTAAGLPQHSGPTLASDDFVRDFPEYYNYYSQYVAGKRLIAQLTQS